MKRLLMALPLLAIAALVGLFAVSSLRHDQRLKDSPWIGKALPALSGDGLDGTAVSFVSRNGYILNIWASWCAPCREEHPTLMAIKNQGIPVRGLLFKDKPDAGQRFLAEHGNPFSSVLLDPTGEIALSLGVSGAPESFVVGADGRVKLKIVGPIDEALWRQKIAPILDTAR